MIWRILWKIDEMIFWKYLFLWKKKWFDLKKRSTQCFVLTKLIKFWILKKARKTICFDLCSEKKNMLRFAFERVNLNERKNIKYLIVDNQVLDAMRKVAIESKNSFCTQRSRRMTGNSKLLLSAIYRHLGCKRGKKDENTHFLIGLAKNLFFILSCALKKVWHDSILFWMRDFTNSRDRKLIIPDWRRFGIMMPWWKW